MAAEAPAAGRDGEVAVIGAITRDEVICADGGTHAGLGGVLYNAVTLTACGLDRVRVFSSAGADVAGDLDAFARRHPAIDLSHVSAASGCNVRCHLWELPHTTLEAHQHYPPPLVPRHLAPALDAPALLVTFPIGRELSLSTLRWLRRRSSGLLYLDFHTLAMASDPCGTRYLRRRRRWLEWVAPADVVQINLAEAAAQAGRPLTGWSERCSLAAEILAAGPRLVLLTLGNGGCLYVEASGSRPTAEHLTVNPVESPRTTVGCGDAFAGGFLASYLRSGDPRRAALAALEAGRLKCEAVGLDALDAALRARSPGGG